jgi:hypothetical protein
MKRGAVGATVAVVSVLVIASAASGLAASRRVGEFAMTTRSFSVQAEGFPVEPAPGMNATSLGIRPLGTRGSLSNAPPDAYGRATTTDLGTIELYTGPPPAGNTAECDATRPNLPRAAEAHPSGALLSATCTHRPSVSVSARAEGPRSDSLRIATQSSHIAADGGGTALVATADVVLTDIDLGPLHIATARFRGRASANGRPRGASASGVVNAVDASVSGVPVVVGTGGVSVDRTRVPTDLVSSATDAVRAAMAQGGYSDVRIVQPRVAAARDGSSATVQGGGVLAFFSNNDPKNDYFLSLTLVGATLKAFVGAPVGVGGRDGIVVGSTPAPLSPAVAGGIGAVDTLPGSVAIPTSDSAAPGAALEPLVGRTTYEAPRPWRGAWVILALAIVMTAAVLGLRRRALPAWDDFATRFLRG